MQRVDNTTVELGPNEMWVKEAQDRHMDGGFGVIQSAEQALLDFWLAFPAAEEDPEASPFTTDFFFYLCGWDIYNHTFSYEPRVYDAWVAVGWPEGTIQMMEEDPVEGRMHLMGVMEELRKERDAFAHTNPLYPRLTGQPENINRTDPPRYGE